MTTQHSSSSLPVRAARLRRAATPTWGVRKSLAGPAAAIVTFAALIAGCSGQGSSSSATGGGNTSVPTIKARSLPKLGTVLVNGQGYPLDMFPPDHHDTVTCTGACAGSWPPVTVPDSQALKTGPEIKKSLVGTVTNPNPKGGQVVTYHGWPLYTYAADTHPGEATGQALDVNGGYWYVMRPSGAIIKSNPHGTG
jgi:predicted lipoprotein with Yx(FWY)xxD motif